MKNLDKLMKVIDILIEDEEKYPIDMEKLRSDGDVSVGFVSSTDCGTTGCILGWCPVLGEGDLIPIGEDFYEEEEEVSTLCFNDYCKRVFDTEFFSQEWSWIFDTHWPDSATEAKKRLVTLMESGVPYDYES